MAEQVRERYFGVAKRRPVCLSVRTVSVRFRRFALATEPMGPTMVSRTWPLTPVTSPTKGLISMYNRIVVSNVLALLVGGTLGCTPKNQEPPAHPESSEQPPASSSEAEPQARVFRPEGAPKQCETAADCKLVDDYCTACDCRVLPQGEELQACEGPGVQCLVAACEGKKAACENNVCVFEAPAGTAY
jgi:hypothetical protein